MSGMSYYSNELNDNFIEIDDTVSNEEYHSSEVKEKKEEDRIPFYNDWKKQQVKATVRPVPFSDSSEEKEKKKKKKEKGPSYDWTHSATVTSPMYYNSQWLPNQLDCANTRQRILDAQQYNGYQNLANACQTQQFIANPTDFIQQQLNINTRYNDIENGLRNAFNALSKFMED